MGGDGGQVIDRATMVKTKGWGLTKGSGNRFAASLGEMANYVQMVTEDTGMGPLERHRTIMTQCFLSQEELSSGTGHVVACKMGNLYNKEAMIGAFLNKTMPAALAHIRKLSDLKTCVIEWKAAEKEEACKNDMVSGNRNIATTKHMVCPVSRHDMDTGGYRAVVIWSTGVVCGAKSLKELKLKECPVTGKPFDYDKDVIPLAPTGEEFAKLKERLPPPKKRKELAASTVVAASASSEKAVFKMPEPVFERNGMHLVKGSASGLANNNPILAGVFGVGSKVGASFTDGANQGLRMAAEREGMIDKDTTVSEADAKKAKTLASSQKGPSGGHNYLSMFCTDREGMSGPRDAFGKPMYNRGSRIV